MTPDSIDRFLFAAAVPVHASHQSGSCDDARAILAEYPAIDTASIYTAAVCGNVEGVREWLTRDPGLATQRGGPHDWDPLTWCCFSRLLRDDREDRARFVAVAHLLLDAGASADTGFTDATHAPEPQHESVLYGAAGVAFCAPLVALLLARGADPNDDEVPYHAAEWYAHDVVAALLASPQPLTRDSLATLLLRKADWHDLAGVEQLLAHGVNPNYRGRWPFTPFQQSLRRDNALSIVEALLDAGGDPLLDDAAPSALAIAAWHGRLEVLQLFAERGVPLTEDGLTAVAVDCAFGDAIGARARLAASAELRDEFLRRLPEFMARCAANGSTAALGALLQFAPSPDVRWVEGDGYWEIAPGSTALHAAAWRAQHSAVRLLLDAGADVHATDSHGRTPLQRAVDARSNVAGALSPSALSAPFAR